VLTLLMARSTVIASRISRALYIVAYIISIYNITLIIIIR